MFVFAELHKVDGKPVVVPAEDMVKSVYFIKIPEEKVTNARSVVRVGIYQDGKKVESINVKFIGPVRTASDAKR